MWAAPLELGYKIFLKFTGISQTREKNRGTFHGLEKCNNIKLLRNTLDVITLKGRVTSWISLTMMLMIIII